MYAERAPQDRRNPVILQTASAGTCLAVHAVESCGLFPIYLFIFIVFLNRYVFGFYLTLVNGRKLAQTIEGYEPTVTIVVPLFNEGDSIYDTIVEPRRSSTIPRDKLEVTVVDDCSTDDSYEWALQGGARLPERHGAAQPAQHGQAQGHQPRRARVDAPRSSSRSTPT